MCFGIRISSPFHLATQIVSIQNLNCLKNAKNACADMIFGMIFHTCKMLFHICKILFHICKIFFHECGIYSTCLSNVCHFHEIFTLKSKPGWPLWEVWFSCRKIDSANFAVLKTSHSSSLLYLSSQQEIFYSALSSEWYSFVSSAHILLNESPKHWLYNFFIDLQSAKTTQLHFVKRG